MERHQLIILRHARAETGDGRDHARALTARGRDEALRVGVLLREKGPMPDCVLSSTARRCRETWQAVSAELGASPTVEFQDALYNASAATLLECLTCVALAKTVLLIAHNPGVSSLAHQLCESDEASAARLRSGFAPASHACFEFEGPWSQLSSGSARLTRFEKSASA